MEHDVDKTLHVSHTLDRRGAALVVVRNMPGEGAEFSPAALRAFAAALVAAADAAEALPRAKRGPTSINRTYTYR